MRRKDREITGLQEITEVMQKCDSLNLALHGGEYPYVVPLNFAFVCAGEQLRLFFHSAKAGTKLELIGKNPNAAFSMDTAHRLVLGSNACGTAMEYESVCGRGKIRILAGAEKFEGLRCLAVKYFGKNDPGFSEDAVENTLVFELCVEEVSGKRLKLQ